MLQCSGGYTLVPEWQVNATIKSWLHCISKLVSLMLSPWIHGGQIQGRHFILQYTKHILCWSCVGQVETLQHKLTTLWKQAWNSIDKFPDFLHAWENAFSMATIWWYRQIVMLKTRNTHAHLCLVLVHRLCMYVIAYAGAGEVHMARYACCRILGEAAWC